MEHLVTKGHFSQSYLQVLREKKTRRVGGWKLAKKTKKTTRNIKIGNDVKFMPEEPCVTKKKKDK